MVLHGKLCGRVGHRGTHIAFKPPSNGWLECISGGLSWPKTSRTITANRSSRLAAGRIEDGAVPAAGVPAAVVPAGGIPAAARPVVAIPAAVVPAGVVPSAARMIVGAVIVEAPTGAGRCRAGPAAERPPRRGVGTGRRARALHVAAPSAPWSSPCCPRSGRGWSGRRGGTCAATSPPDNSTTWRGPSARRAMHWRTTTWIARSSCCAGLSRPVHAAPPSVRRWGSRCTCAATSPRRAPSCWPTSGCPVARTRTTCWRTALGPPVGRTRSRATSRRWIRARSGSGAGSRGSSCWRAIAPTVAICVRRWRPWSAPAWNRSASRTGIRAFGTPLGTWPSAAVTGPGPGSSSKPSWRWIRSSSTSMSAWPRWIGAERGSGRSGRRSAVGRPALRPLLEVAHQAHGVGAVPRQQRNPTRRHPGAVVGRDLVGEAPAERLSDVVQLVVLRHGRLGGLGPQPQLCVRLRQRFGRRSHGAVVRQVHHLRIEGAVALERPMSQDEVEVGRRCGRSDGAHARHLDAHGVAHEQRADVGVEHADVVLGVAGGVQQIQLPAAPQVQQVAVGHAAYALLWDGCAVAVHRVVQRAVGAPGAGSPRPCWSWWPASWWWKSWPWWACWRWPPRLSVLRRSDSIPAGAVPVRPPRCALSLIHISEPTRRTP